MPAHTLEIHRAGIGAITDGPTYINMWVKERDYDGDGLAAWEDCDDNDNTNHDDGSGESEHVRVPHARPSLMTVTAREMEPTG